MGKGCGEVASEIDGPIGIFDSGIGGLSLVQSIHHEMPQESITYYADLKNLPYGEKTEDQVCQYSLAVAQHLKEQGAKLIVVACSTASAVAAEVLRSELDVPIVTVLNPYLLQEITRQTENKRIGVVSTRLTHESEMFRHWIQSEDPSIEVFSSPASELVDLISEGELNTSEIVDEVQALVVPLIEEQGVDQIILGCTHFNFVESIFQAVLPVEVALVSAPKPTAIYVRQLLKEQDCLKEVGGNGLIEFEASQYDPIFENFIQEQVIYAKS